MRVTVKTKNFSLSEAVAIYLERKLGTLTKLLKRAEAQIGKTPGMRGRSGVVVRVDLGKTTRHHRKGGVYRAEINLAIPGRGVLRAEAETEDLHAAIDLVRDELAREIRSWKGKKQDQEKRGGRELKRRLRGE